MTCDVIHRAEFPIALTNGNDGRGSKWFSSAKLRNEIEGTLRALGHARSVPFDSPVKLRFTRVLGARQSLWDADSVQRGNLKELVDSLVAIGWLVDDGPNYVTEVSVMQHSQTPRPTHSTTIVEVML